MIQFLISPVLHVVLGRNSAN